MSRRRFSWLLASCVVGLACVHSAGDRPTHPWRPSFLDDVPRCASVEGAISVGEVAGRTVGDRVVVRGHLAHSGWSCTEAACVDPHGKPPACCNSCSAELALIDAAGGEARLFLQPSGEKTRLALRAADCQTDLLDESALARTFVASGVVAEPGDLPVGAALLSDARLCRAGD